jgi:hypothetical protein
LERSSRVALGELELLCGGLSESILEGRTENGVVATGELPEGEDREGDAAMRITASPIIFVGESSEMRTNRIEPELDVDVRSELAPLSTAPSVVSVRSPRISEPRAPLAWLGEQTRSRPFAVAAGASFGSLLLVFAMLGAVRLGRAFDGRTAHAANTGRGLERSATAPPMPSVAAKAQVGSRALSTAAPPYGSLAAPSATAQP